MARKFSRLSKQEQAAVSAYVRWEFDKLVSFRPGSYVCRKAQNDPDGWQEKLRELIAADPEQVAAIVEASAKAAGTPSKGFTLIELSIVLVIIGLIVGGILAGQSLINAATIRAQISQIEKYQTATATFREKYGYLPGDITPQAVTQFGFTAGAARSGGAGDGDGNGELDGTYYGLAYTWAQTGENLYFWEDLSTNSHLIEGGFNAATGPATWGSCTSILTCSVYFPYAKTGNGAFVYTYSGYAQGCCTAISEIGPNFFGLNFVSSLADGGNVANGVAIPPAPSLSVAQAYAIDSKIDDGLPTTGNVLAQYLTVAMTGRPGWSANGATPSATTCYDTSSGTAAYSVKYQNGANVTCGISFKMQAGD